MSVGAVSPPTGKVLEIGDVFMDDYVWWRGEISERSGVFVFKIENDKWEQVSAFKRDQILYEKVGWTATM